ncbi:MAG: sterol desaturase family protein [Bdellovibrionales bacterium]|nr:sterol desaturase family protein [Bdellovibrionales bacterium]
MDQSYNALKPQRFRFGEGHLAGFLSLFLGLLCVLGAIGFHFPQYASTPEIRKFYNVEYLRWLMSLMIFVSIGCGCFNLIRSKHRSYGAVGIGLTTLCLMLGGPFIPVGDFPDHTPYVGLDWLIMDLIGSGLIFILIEKAFPYQKDRPVLRQEWSLDALHFSINHLLIGVTLLVANAFAANAFGWARITPIMSFVQSLPFIVELFLIVLAADLIQYTLHRSMHEIPVLWRVHAVHHCPESMDWLSGSRQHFIELIATRACVFVPIFVLGFEKHVIDAYVIIVGFQAVLNHANVDLNFGFFEKIIVTPQFHHWHHSSDKEALDRNYAAHFSFIDTLLGTRVHSDKKWPEAYGLVGRNLPASYIAHLTYPFQRTFWLKKGEEKGASVISARSTVD